MSFDDDENLETTLVVIKSCFVYKIPVRTTTHGYRAADWDLSTPLWTGRCVVTSAGTFAKVKLEDPNTGEVFAVCPVTDGSIEPVNDSSRYYVIKIEDQGRHAFIGMGFQERNDAFDFSAALQDHAKFIKQKKESEDMAKKAASQPKIDYSLKEGQKIHVEFKTAKKSTTPSSPSTQPSLTGGLLPPPPSASNRVKAPQQNQATSAFNSGSSSASSLFDFDPSFNQNSFPSQNQQQSGNQNQQFFQQNQFNQQNQMAQQNQQYPPQSQQNQFQFQTSNDGWGDFTGSGSPNVAPKASTSQQQSSNNMFDFFN